MKKIGTLLIITFALGFGSVRADIVTFTSKADAFFKQYVTGGRVNYANVKKNFSEIDALYKEVNTYYVEEIDPYPLVKAGQP